MAIKKFKAMTPGTRFRAITAGTELTRKGPEKSLTESLHKKGGRNHHGHITMRRRGGGHKRKYRKIDFRRNKFGVEGRVAEIEYDPNRSANIALLCYRDGERRYILAPDGLKVGASVVASPDADIVAGNALPLSALPLGTQIHNIELRPQKGGQLVRSAGGSAQLMAKEGDYAQVKLPSGEVRKIRVECYATVGQVGNLDHENVKGGKAGRNRWKGRRPKVRGVVMNPVDHPHGGGEGRTSGGRHPVTPWGVPTKGKKTRNNPRTDKFIVRRRKKR